MANDPAAASVRVSDPIATIRSFVTSPVNAVAFGHVTQDDALAALDSLAAALAQAEQDRDEARAFADRMEACDCIGAIFSSAACQKCGRRAVVTKDSYEALAVRLNKLEARLAQAHEALREICEMPSGRDMLILARRVLAGEGDSE